jgi:hypothetical protein
MHRFQRFAIVLLAGAYWLVSVLIVEVLNAWMSGASLTPEHVLWIATPAALAGSFFGLIAAIASYFFRVSGSTFQRVSIGVVVGLIFWSLTIIFRSHVGMHGTVADSILRVLANPMVASLLGAFFGLVTTRRLFFLFWGKQQ